MFWSKIPTAVLFDKVNHSLYNAFYQLFDEGIFVDTNYEVDIRNGIFILTSNFATEAEIKQGLGTAMYSRMPVEEAKKPGSTDPRNETMMRMFAMVEIGERAGSGMDKIFEGWAWAGYAEPSYEVAYGPDRTTLTLPLVSADSAGEAPSKTVEARR